MTIRQKTVFSCLQGTLAQNFLLLIHIDGLDHHISSVEYPIILRYRLMINLFSIDEVCLVCRKMCLVTFGEHTIHYKELSSFKYHHNLVRKVLFDIFQWIEISMKKKTSINILTNPH